MERHRDRNRPGFGYHLKVHTFRTLTAVLAWGLVVAAFYQKPELLTSAQRLMQRGIEAVGDAVPSPWGARMEFVFREIGGVIWLQITMLILTLRMMLSTIAATWRLVFRATGPSSPGRMSDPVALAVYANLGFFCLALSGFARGISPQWSATYRVYLSTDSFDQAIASLKGHGILRGSV